MKKTFPGIYSLVREARKKKKANQYLHILFLKISVHTLFLVGFFSIIQVSGKHFHVKEAFCDHPN